MLQDLKQFIIGNLIAGLLIKQINDIPWNSLILIILKKFGIHYYSIHETNTAKRIQTRLASKTSIIQDERAYGYIYDYNLIAKISENDGSGLHVWMYCSKNTYESLTSEDTPSKVTSGNVTSDEVKEEPKHAIKIYERSSNYSYTGFYRRNISIHSVTGRLNQNELVSNIMNVFSKKTHAVALIHGAPNTGKSTIGLLIANKLKGSYCNTLKPWLPNCSLIHLYSTVEPTQENPLIISMDEFDVPLMNIHNGLIKPNENMATFMIDKAGWNTFFDEIQRGTYPYVIVLLTTNKTPQFINELDPCYIREGRVDITQEVC
jgi:hypothetical protein